MCDLHGSSFYLMFDLQHDLEIPQWNQLSLSTRHIRRWNASCLPAMPYPLPRVHKWHQRHLHRLRCLHAEIRACHGPQLLLLCSSLLQHWPCSLQCLLLSVRDLRVQLHLLPDLLRQPVQDSHCQPHLRVHVWLLRNRSGHLPVLLEQMLRVFGHIDQLHHVSGSA